jgi:hypothetical protein
MKHTLPRNLLFQREMFFSEDFYLKNQAIVEQ